MVDWSKLKPYQNDKRKSFEELCYQIAKKRYGDRGKFTSIDDSGGGDGVEFFLTFSDGTEWGWQAKFYYPQPRLNPSRKKSIEESLVTSLENHHNLTKWFLCTPTNFTVKGSNNELSWFNATLKRIAQQVELEHWGDSDFSEMLSNPRMVGKLRYFFGELEFSPEWFAKQVTKQVANVREKFLPTLHTETRADFRVHCMLGDETFRDVLALCCEAARAKLRKFQGSVEKMQKYGTEDEWKNTVADFSHLCAGLQTQAKAILEMISECLMLVQSGYIEEAQKTDFTVISNTAQNHTKEYQTRHSSLRKDRMTKAGNLLREEREANDRTMRQILHDFSEPMEVFSEIVEILHRAETYIDNLKKTDLHVFGGAGMGKTHLTCHVCQERVKADLPAILLLGSHFSRTSTIERSMLNICDVPASYSWSDFLAALDSYAEAHRTRVLIAIDALNDAESVKLWRQELSGFIASLADFPRLALLTTCRTSYQEVIWDKGSPPNRDYVYGFHGEDLKKTLAKYFDYYKLKADLTLEPLEQFKHPIYLRVFCESQNPERGVEKEVYLGRQTLFKVFEQFLINVNNIICARLSKPPSSRIVQGALSKLAKALWEQNARHLNWEDALVQIDGKNKDEVDWDRSLTRSLLDEGLLISRNWRQEEETVSFTYDLLGGYLISTVLIHGLNAEGVQSFVESQTFKQRLTSEDYNERHPLGEDILRCLCALLPEQTGIHLYTITKDEVVFSASIDALFEMNPSLIKDEQRSTLERLFELPENRQPLLRLARQTAFNVGHPLNFSFWEGLLRTLPMPERDGSWTEFVRSNSTELMEDLDQFEQLCRGPQQLTPLAQARLHLAVRYFAWLLTSTHCMLRDTATRALYWYGRRFPEQLFDLTLKSFTINDPYIPERLLAASYGVTMTLHANPLYSVFTNDTLPNYGRKLFEVMFKKGAPNATTHALMRDYAKHTIDIALLHNPNFLDKQEKKRITPPYRDGGIRRWGRSEDLNKEEYRDGNAPLSMDFENYTLGHLIPSRHNYDFENQEYKEVRANIYWRLYKLGYSLKVFGEIDKELASSGWERTEENESRIDRYGKKYAWIAYFELYGHRHDKGLLKSEWREDHGRPSDVDIDPSFPDEPHTIQMIAADFLGDRSTALREWVECGEQPDIEPYLFLNEIDGETGPWVLLDGHANQDEQETRRGLFVFLRGLLVEEHRFHEFLRFFQKQNLGGRWLPEIPEDHYTFAGETPWGDTFPLNEMSEVHFQIEQRIRKVPQTKVHLREKRTSEFLNPLTKKFPILIPVRQNSWESYHSGVNPHQSAVIPARELAEALGLWIHLPSWDLYDIKGKRASISIDCRESWRTRQQLTYLRQDLLEQFLEMKKMVLLWGIWGEREVRFRKNELSQDFHPYKGFQQIYRYGEGKIVFLDRSENTERN